MFTHEFVRNAWLGGTFIALACGVIGWFVVVRAQVFAGDALSHVAFVGAIAAAAVGVDERIGLFALTLALAGAMGMLGRRAQADDVTIGISFAWILGIGVLLLTILATSAAGASGITTANTLFGSVYSLSAGGAVIAAAVALAATGFVLGAARPLLLATLDPELATLRGVPVRALGLAFLAALAVISAESTQAVGALLLLGLIAAPGGAARALTARPYRGLALSGAIAVASMWGGLALSYAISALPASTAIIGLAAGAYAAAGLWSRVRQRLSAGATR
ncbi:MAG TPA: metal ABC transporter permease [Solirubrobacteraceae bacterium]|jgi:zinc/manganese transport system permease protein|nr:metal ABC transporter permease [Solirubrobacteraceae bacterium]